MSLRSGGSRDVLARPRAWIHGVLDFARRCLERFVSMDGFDRSMALAAQAFTALFPLLIIVAATAESGKGQSLGDQLIEKFGLKGRRRTASTARFHPRARSPTASRRSAR